MELPWGAKCSLRTGSGECPARRGCWCSRGLERESQKEVKGGWAESVAGDLNQDVGKEPRGRNGTRRGRLQLLADFHLKGSS